MHECVRVHLCLSTSTLSPSVTYILIKQQHNDKEKDKIQKKSKENNKNLYRFQNKMCYNNIYKTLFQMRFGEEEERPF